MTRPVLRTPLTELLGIEYPVLQSGMGAVAGPELVAEVCRAGGLGILAGLRVEAPELRRRIHRVRELTDRPFGVNLWLHPALRPPADVAALPDATVRAVQGALNPFRTRMGLPETLERPAPVPNLIAAALEVILDERVPLWSVGLGDPGPDLVGRCHQHGVRVMAMVASVEDARAVAASGVDVVVAQGLEAGGHRSSWSAESAGRGMVGTLALVPQVVDAVEVPVVAAGGLADGRGLVAALALGAGGVLLGTRFVATRESDAPAAWKKAILERESHDTVVSAAVSGLPARYIRNRFLDEYDASGAPVLPPLVQSSAAETIFKAAGQRDDPDHLPMPSGQSVGLIRDLPGAGEVVASVVSQAVAVLAALPRRVRAG